MNILFYFNSFFRSNFCYFLVFSRSLQLQVKRLEEEKSKEHDGNEEKKPDLPVPGEKKLSENDKTGGELEETEPTNSEPETRRLDESTTNTDKLLPTTGDESDRENQSVNESNSTGSRFEALKTGEGDVKLEPGPVQVNTGLNEPDPIKKPIGEESNNGSYDNEAKVPTCESMPPSEEMKVEGDSSELHDSVTHSEERGTRDSGEVESSASLTRKRNTRRKKEVATENEEGAVVKSEPLVGVLEMIKGHENISFFERRLQSQVFHPSFFRGQNRNFRLFQKFETKPSLICFYFSRNFFFVDERFWRQNNLL